MLLVCAACTNGSTPQQTQPGPAPSISLVAMPPKFLSKCQAIPQLRPACPKVIASVDHVRLLQSHASRVGKDIWVFSAEWNAPWPGLTSRNAPPAFTHVNVIAGNVGRMAGFPIHKAPSGPFAKERRVGLSLGKRRWSGRTGVLLLAPSEPSGGLEGDHLVFRWTQRNTHYSISLHAWQPIQQTEATLSRVVASLPKVR
jgi:hypothetical protein